MNCEWCNKTMRQVTGYMVSSMDLLAMMESSRQIWIQHRLPCVAMWQFDIWGGLRLVGQWNLGIPCNIQDVQ
jgi:hypothetical protein